MQFNLRSLFRACCVVAALAGWYALSMRSATFNTSWEHHPFAGPFIFFKESRSVIEFLVSGVIALGILIPALFWVRTGSSWVVAVAITAALASIALSYACALSASV